MKATTIKACSPYQKALSANFAASGKPVDDKKALIAVVILKKVPSTGISRRVSFMLVNMSVNMFPVVGLTLALPLGNGVSVGIV